MPYISKNDNRREKLRKGEPALNAGELNYQIFYYVKHYDRSPDYVMEFDNTVKKFIKQFLGKKPNYQRYNDLTGCLIRCYREIKRRLNINADYLEDFLNEYDDEIAKYEDKKIIENSDVE